MKISLSEEKSCRCLEGKRSSTPPNFPERTGRSSLWAAQSVRIIGGIWQRKKGYHVVVHSHTHSLPSKIITPILLRRIRSVSSDARIRILVATGFHRPTYAELNFGKYGEKIVLLTIEELLYCIFLRMMLL